MLDTKKTVIEALELTGLPVYYEQHTTSTSIPCITYKVNSDCVNKYGDTLGYSNVSYQIKFWDTSIENLSTKMETVDSNLRAIGLRRTNYNELVNNELIIGISNYEGLVREIFN